MYISKTKNLCKHRSKMGQHVSFFSTLYGVAEFMTFVEQTAVFNEKGNKMKSIE